MQVERRAWQGFLVLVGANAVLAVLLGLPDWREGSRILVFTFLSAGVNSAATLVAWLVSGPALARGFLGASALVLLASLALIVTLGFAL